MEIDIEKLIPETGGSKLLFQSLGNFDELQSQLMAQRLNLGLSQKELANRMGISQPAISQLENSGAEMSFQTLISYAAALGLEIKFSCFAQPSA